MNLKKWTWFVLPIIFFNSQTLYAGITGDLIVHNRSFAPIEILVDFHLVGTVKAKETETYHLGQSADHSTLLVAYNEETSREIKRKAIVREVKDFHWSVP